jgi:predicted dehydrogenase
VKTKISVGVIGLEFGGEFAPIYREHPNVAEVAICDTREDYLHADGKKFGFAKRFANYRDMLDDASLDAIHVVTGLASHEQITVDALDAGKHCACTVPMALSLDGLRRVVDAAKRSAKNYMMMETAVYTRHCLFAKDMHDRGEMGRVQYMRGTHYQDDENWPDYWKGLPPLWYATHAVGPMMFISGAKAKTIHALGSGRLTEAYKKQYGNPFPIETGIIEFEAADGHPLTGEVARSLFNTAIQYRECFSIYGDKKSFEWNIEDETPYIFEITGPGGHKGGRQIATTRHEHADYSHRLPESIRRFTRELVWLDPSDPRTSVVMQGGAHHGSHPHMVHEFVSSIVEGRKSAINETVAANWCAVGICGHESAMNNGAGVAIPQFS